MKLSPAFAVVLALTLAASAYCPQCDQTLPTIVFAVLSIASVAFLVSAGWFFLKKKKDIRAAVASALLALGCLTLVVVLSLIAG